MRKSAEVVRLEAPKQSESEVPNETAASPLYGVAMLKIAMELKRQDSAALDDILAGVLRKMNLPEEDFRSYLAQNGGLLRAIAQRRRY